MRRFELIVLACLVCGTATAQAQDSTKPVQSPAGVARVESPPAPAQGTASTRVVPAPPPKVQLLASGFLMMAASYAPTAMYHWLNPDHTTDNLYIPVAGPWLELAREPTSIEQRPWLAMSGVAQDLGAFFFFVGLVMPGRKSPTERALAQPRFWASPLTGPGAYGMSARGRF
jgi:hypothetical protein